MIAEFWFPSVRMASVEERRLDLLWSFPANEMHQKYIVQINKSFNMLYIFANRLTLNCVISLFICWTPSKVSLFFFSKCSSVLQFSSSMCIISHDIKALSHTEWMDIWPDINALNSLCGIDSDSCVKFSMNEIAQHWKINNYNWISQI